MEKLKMAEKMYKEEKLKRKTIEKMEEKMVNIKIIKGKTWISKWDE